MTPFRCNLKTKILAISFSTMALTMIMGSFAIWRLSSSLTDYEKIVSQLVQQEVELEKISLELSTQLNHWHNFLLRGKQGATQYWDYFKKSEEIIFKSSKKLSEHLEDPAIKNSLKEFIEYYEISIKTYEKGYEHFINSQYSYKRAEANLNKLDDKPAKLLNNAMYLINNKIKDNTSKVSKNSQAALWFNVPLFFIIACLSAFAFYWFLYKEFTRPLFSLAKTVKELSQGDFSKPIHSERKDEIGQIIRHLADTQRFIQSLMNQIRSISTALTQDADIINQSSSQIAHETQENNHQLELTATAITEMSCTVQEVAQNALGAADAAALADESAKNGLETMEFSINTINTLSTEVLTAADIIRQLEEETNSIGKVLDVIRGIAEQTNLLALNAAIEAARAGEQGRGFAVVADEVRNLAQRTQDSTSEIQQIIESVQSGAKNAVLAMNKGSESAVACVDQSTIADESLKDITTSVNKIHGMNTQIATAAEQQTTVAEDLSKSVNHIAHSMNTIHSNVKSFNELSTSLAEMASQLNEAANHMKL